MDASAWKGLISLPLTAHWAEVVTWPYPLPGPGEEGSLDQQGQSRVSAPASRGFPLASGSSAHRAVPSLCPTPLLPADRSVTGTVPDFENIAENRREKDKNSCPQGAFNPAGPGDENKYSKCPIAQILKYGHRPILMSLKLGYVLQAMELLACACSQEAIVTRWSSLYVLV